MDSPLLALIAYAASLYYVGLVAERLSCPALVGEILVGMVLGPHGAKLLPAELVSALSVAGQVGLLLMVCEGGLSMDLKVLKTQGVRATVLALTGTILPVALGAPLMIALKYEWMAAVASGTALSSTAIGFTLRLMSDLGLMETPQGQLITAAAMLDDVFSLVLLAMLQVLVDGAASTEDDNGDTGYAANLSTPGPGAAMPSPPSLPPQMQTPPIAWLITRPLLASFSVFVVSLLLGAIALRMDASLRSFLSVPATGAIGTSSSCSSHSPASESANVVIVDDPAAMAPAEAQSPPAAVGLKAAETTSSSTARREICEWLFSDDATLALLLGMGVLAAWGADALYSSSLLGAFLAGTIFCSFDRARHAWQVVSPVQAWLTRAFFGATVAFTVPLDALLDGGALGHGMLLTLAAILGKFLSGAWAAPLRSPDGSLAGRAYWCPFLQVGCAMIGRGELGFVLAKEALEAGLMPSRAYCATVWALLLATLLGPFAFRLSLRCGRRR